MLSVDVNVLVHAFDVDDAPHESARAVLDAQRLTGEAMVLFPAVLAGFLRVVTDRRIKPKPAEPREALSFLRAVLAAPTVTLGTHGPATWAVFERLLERYPVRGPDVQDVFLAAAAIEHGATWISYDRGFSRFTELRWRTPADDA